MWLFKKKAKKEPKPVPPIPVWEEIVEHMQSKEPSWEDKELVRILVSRDRAKRLLIWKDPRGFYTVSGEQILVFDEDEWMYYGQGPDAYPAWWAECGPGGSIYASAEAAFREIEASVEYRTYF